MFGGRVEGPLGKEEIAAGLVSRILSAAHKEQQGDHSSRPHITARLQRPTRKLWRTEPARRPVGRPPLFGLAPCGVCPATAIAGGAVRSYRTFSPLPRRLRSRKRITWVKITGGAVCSLWHFPLTALDGRPPDVIRHTALWSSDFPLSACAARTNVRRSQAGSDRPAQQLTQLL